MKISKKIIEIRKNNDLTQESFAEKIGVTRQTVSNWENEKCYPDVETLVFISDVFNISLDILLKGDKEMIQKIDKTIKFNKINKVVIVILSILFCVFMWIGYKVYLLNVYNHGYKDQYLEKYNDNLDNLNIVYNNSLANSSFGNLKLTINDKLEERSEYSLHLKKGEDYYLSIFKYDTPFYEIESFKDYYNNVNYDNLFKKYNINNSYDLIKYFEENFKENRSIFWNKSKIKMDFIAKRFIIQQIDYGDALNNNYYLNGSIKGILNEKKNCYLIEIYYKDDIYLLNFNKEKYILENVIDILNTIYFE